MKTQKEIFEYAATKVFKGQASAEEWFNSFVPVLHGFPIYLMDTEEGRDLVLKVLRKIEYGEFI